MGLVLGLMMAVQRKRNIETVARRKNGKTIKGSVKVAPAQRAGRKKEARTVIVLLLHQ